MQLRPYQTAAIDALSQGFREGHLRQLLMMPTGSGKTATAGEMVRRAAERGHRSLFIVDRIELAGQAVRHLQSLGLPTGLMQGENTFYSDSDAVIVASIQTLARRGVPNSVQLIVIDEAHILHKAHLSALCKYNLIPAVGLSATPLRKGLGCVFSRLVQGPSIAQWVERDHLVPVRAFGPTQDKVQAAIEGVRVSYSASGRDYAQGELSAKMRRKELVGDIVSTWNALAAGMPTLCFAVDIAHSKAIVDDFRAEGVAAEHLDAFTDDADRRAIIQRYRCGETKLLSSVSVLSIGFDVPIATCAILARPTLSLALHIQQVGRVMRPASSKTSALVLDHAGNFARHGKPEDFVIERLEDGEFIVRKPQKAKAELKPCTDCGYLLDLGQRECPNCGSEPRRSNTVHQVDGELVEIGGGGRVSQVVDERAFYQQLRYIGISRDWKPQAAAAQCRRRFKRWPPCAWNDLPPKLPDAATLRWLTSQQIRYRKALQRSI